MRTADTPFDELLTRLVDARRRVATSQLVRLSGLYEEEAGRLAAVWSGLALARRRLIVSRLAELAEDNLELDFDQVYLIALTDADAQVRARAVEGLWDSEDVRLTPKLIDIIQHDPDETVRAHAAIGLRHFSLMAELGELSVGRTQEIRSALMGVLANSGEEVEVRRRALEALGPFSDATVHGLISQAYEQPERGMRSSALYAMGQTCDHSWLPLLRKELGNADAEMRYEAAHALGEYGQDARETVLALLPLLSDADPQVRLAAVRALGTIGGNEAARALRRVRGSGDERTREAVEDALEEIKFYSHPLSLGLIPRPRDDTADN